MAMEALAYILLAGLCIRAARNLRREQERPPERLVCRLWASRSIWRERR